MEDMADRQVLWEKGFNYRLKLGVLYFFLLGILHVSQSAPGTGPHQQPSASYIQLYQLAQQQFGLELHQDALETIKQAIQLEPLVAAGYNFKGVCLTKLKSYELAQVSFHKAAELDPQLNSMAQYNTGEIFFLTGKYDQALESYQHFIETTPPPIQVRLAKMKMLICQLKLGQMIPAQQLQAQLPLTPKDPASYLAEAAFLFESGQREAAMELILSVQKVYPPTVNSLFLESFYSMGYLKPVSKQQLVTLKTPQLQSLENQLDYSMIPPESSPLENEKERADIGKIEQQLAPRSQDESSSETRSN